MLQVPSGEGTHKLQMKVALCDLSTGMEIGGQSYRKSRAESITSPVCMWLKSPMGEYLAQATSRTFLHSSHSVLFMHSHKLNRAWALPFRAADNCHVLFTLAHETWETRESPIEEEVWGGALEGGQGQMSRTLKGSQRDRHRTSQSGRQGALPARVSGSAVGLEDWVGKTGWGSLCHPLRPPSTHYLPDIWQ